MCAANLIKIYPIRFKSYGKIHFFQFWPRFCLSQCKMAFGYINAQANFDQIVHMVQELWLVY